METNAQGESKVVGQDTHPFDEDFYRENPNFMVKEFGGCPKCGGNDGAVIIGDEYGLWCVCCEHKAKWFFESDLHLRMLYEKGALRYSPVISLDGYEEVKPLSVGLEAKFSELQAQFFAFEIGEYHELMTGCLGMLEHLLPNGNSGAQGEISQIVLREIRRRLVERRDWILDTAQVRERMERYGDGQCTREAASMPDIPF
jgi:hypothetical protein